MAKVDKPEIGAEMYAVFEHLYSNKSAPARSLKEYCVCKGTVRSFYTGSYTDVCMLFRGPEGCPLLSYYKLEDIGKKLFYKAADAAELAKSMTDFIISVFAPIFMPENRICRNDRQTIAGTIFPDC